MPLVVNSVKLYLTAFIILKHRFFLQLERNEEIPNSYQGRCLGVAVSSYVYGPPPISHLWLLFLEQENVFPVSTKIVCVAGYIV